MFLISLLILTQNGLLYDMDLGDGITIFTSNNHIPNVYEY